MDFPVPSAPTQQGRKKAASLCLMGLLGRGDSSHGALAANWVHNKVNKALMVFAINCN